MIRKSDKKLKDRTKEDKIAKNEGFDEFFNQVLKNMPARSAKIIKSSFVVSKALKSLLKRKSSPCIER
ncbi:hypothetical protein FDX20_27750, partial [Citrobacter sp. TBCS-11]